MSIFASRVRKPFDVASGGATLAGIVQKLSFKSLEKARTANTIAQALPLRAMGGELIRTINSPALDEAVRKLEEEMRSKKADPEAAHYGQYDLEETLVAGLVSWDAEVALSRDAVADLDEGIAKAVRKIIVDLSDPYVPDVEAPKGDSGASSSI
jgi:hypothetical protein